MICPECERDLIFINNRLVCPECGKAWNEILSEDTTCYDPKIAKTYNSIVAYEYGIIDDLLQNGQIYGLLFLFRLLCFLSLLLFIRGYSALCRFCLPGLLHCRIRKNLFLKILHFYFLFRNLLLFGFVFNYRHLFFRSCFSLFIGSDLLRFSVCALCLRMFLCCRFRHHFR